MQDTSKPAHIELIRTSQPSRTLQQPGARKNLQNEQLRRMVRQGAGKIQQYPLVLYPTSTGLMQEPSKRDFVIDSLKEYRRQIAGGVVPSINDHLIRGRSQKMKGNQLGLSRLTDLSRSEANRQELAISARLNKSYHLSDEVSHHRGNASRELSLDFGQLDGSHIDYVSHFTTLEKNSSPQEGQDSGAEAHNLARSGVQTAEWPTQVSGAKSWHPNGRTRLVAAAAGGGQHGRHRHADVPTGKPAPREYRDTDPRNESLEMHIENWKVKSVLREHNPDLTLKPTNPEYPFTKRGIRLDPSDPQLPQLIKQRVKSSLTGKKTDRERSHDEEDLDRKIFYYRFDRNLTLLENREKILSQLSSQVQSNPRLLLTSLLIPEKIKRRLRSTTADTAHDTGKQAETSTRSRPLPGLTDSERELLQRSKLPLREFKRRPRMLSGDVSEIPVVFEMAGVESKEQEEAKYEAARRHDQQVAARQKQIADKLEAINHHVEEVFMVHNNNKKVSVNGVITITLIDYLAEALKHADKLRELESTMIGLYNNLQDIGFFRMFRMSEACHIFSWCRMAQYAKGTKLKITNKSNLLVLLRGRFSVNDPGPVLYDDEGKIILDSYKIPSVKDGVYEHVCFTLTDGDYLTPNVFKFMNRKLVANFRGCKIVWSFGRMHGRHYLAIYRAN